MKKIFLFSIIFAAFISCKGKDKSLKTSSDKKPAFITAKIEEYKKSCDPKKCPVITRYSYNGKSVYYFKMPCCDQFNVLYDADGNEMCKPDGGFTGKGDGKCNDFNSLKKDPKQIWPEKPED